MRGGQVGPGPDYLVRAKLTLFWSFARGYTAMRHMDYIDRDNVLYLTQMALTAGAGQCRTWFSG